ncbi:uncharacterized protein JCM6883_002579 [Sporobolomyces salmoneus]|uniref:uncharacterized protein n=1 Tax=Sporobolomyces salmoneus TaxID=183962 RepID=UPI0031703C50
MASSRLKRKLELTAADPSSSSEFGNLSESFVTLGTALPSLTDNKKDKNEFKPVWEQEVYDDQGRRRLHGAFTGGFSAGYYNTVGSKEGWTPSTFKSSRSNRASNKQRDVTEAAREYMDEEDLAELAASRTIETNQAYSTSSSSKPHAPAYDPLLGQFGTLSSTSQAPAPPSSSSTFDDALTSLIQPSTNRVGLKLMQKMGWRPSQGIGPRITYSQRQRQARELGITLPVEEEEGEGDEEAKKHLYAPLDRPLVSLKEGKMLSEKGWGLGYKPGDTLGKKLGREGIGGTGQRGREELEDPYADHVEMGSKKAFRVMEDLEEDEDEGYRIAGSSKGRQQAKKKPPPRTTSEKGMFHDGTPVLPGFSLHTEANNFASTSQLPPAPPPGWKPDPTRLWNRPQETSTNGKGKGKGKQLDANERGTLLGEEPPKPVPKSVFDYLSSKSRARLSSLTNTSSTTSTSTFSPSTSSNSVPVAPGKFNSKEKEKEKEAEVSLYVPPLDRPTALSALKGFQPYSSASTSPDPIKQARYTLYLQHQSSSSGPPSTTSSPFGPRKLPNGKLQTVEELNRELQEYASSAKVFKPVSGMLGNRFESSKLGALDAPKIEPGLYQPTPKTSTTSTDYLTSTYGDATGLKGPEKEVPKLTMAQQAAREGNFGSLTRTTVPFRPAKLLCKRFGVKDPYEEAGGGGPEDLGGVGGVFGEATATGWSTGDSSRAGMTSQPVGDSMMEQMRESQGFKQFEAAARVVDENEPEVAKGTFETRGSRGDGNGDGKKMTIETVGLGDDEEQGKEILEEEKAPMDLFDLIFGDSDDEDEDEDDGKEKEPEAVIEKKEEEVKPESESNPPPAPKPSVPLDEPTTLTEPVTLDTVSSYKPNFTSRSTAEPSTASSSTKPPKKKKSKRKVALSFDLDGEEEEDVGSISSERSKKRLKKEERPSKSKPSREKPKPIEEVEEEWEEATEAVHPSILAALDQKTTTSTNTTAPVTAAESKVKQPRMTAKDLY